MKFKKKNYSLKKKSQTRQKLVLPQDMSCDKIDLL